MYIKKYWGNFIGGSDDSLNLVAFLEDQKQEEIPLSEIFAKIGLDKQNWDFRQTVEYLEFTHSNGVEMDFHFASDVVTDLAAILLECSVSGSVNLQDLDEYNTLSLIHILRKGSTFPFSMWPAPIVGQSCREKSIKQRRRFHILAKSGMDENLDRKSTRLNSSHITRSRMPSSA